MTRAAAQLHHIALTVRDFATSVPWYENVFDVRYLMDAPHEGGTAKILVNHESGLAFALHVHEATEAELFAETRIGLDHVGFVVPTREDLVAWQDHLAEHGVERTVAADKPLTQSPIADEDYGSVLVFRDPDNIQLEIFSPPAT